MNSSKDSENQLSLLSDVRQSRPSCVNARMATNVLQRLLAQTEGISPSSAVFFKAVFPSVVSAAEQAQGLPVTKTTLRPRLADPAAAITLRPPTRPEEFAQMETLLEFVQRRLSSEAERKRLNDDIDRLLGAQNPELLITSDGMPSQLYAADRAEAVRIFKSIPGEASPAAEHALVEAFVLLRSNNADIQGGIASLFWRQNTGSAPAVHSIEGCADGQTRAFFRELLALPEERQQELFSSINLEAFYAALETQGEANG